MPGVRNLNWMCLKQRTRSQTMNNQCQHQVVVTFKSETLFFFKKAEEPRYAQPCGEGGPRTIGWDWWRPWGGSTLRTVRTCSSRTSTDTSCSVRRTSWLWLTGSTSSRRPVWRRMTLRIRGSPGESLWRRHSTTPKMIVWLSTLRRPHQRSQRDAFSGNSSLLMTPCLVQGVGSEGPTALPAPPQSVLIPGFLHPVPRAPGRCVGAGAQRGALPPVGAWWTTTGLRLPVLVPATPTWWRRAVTRSGGWGAGTQTQTRDELSHLSHQQWSF